MLFFAQDLLKFQRENSPEVQIMFLIVISKEEYLYEIFITTVMYLSTN